MNEPVRQLRVVAVAFASGAFDDGQGFANGVYQREQPAADLRVQNDLAAAEAAQQVLTNVGDAFQT
jgi:hypothetical protein